ncbi:hypothetical protein EHS13_23645 [Paenibacillus psychroresistens]|uniref:Uncharacterized protein n=1 Tax=Paenibacillus psychroresistens TaxID=1778678 RepID=A0A6B8RNR9_9BACL|nr:hypothetical protein [Paenibacillus psychroresistens]QGQ97669.1 hypothetical protein EHS13_23645 [Paenibacillus psychroresistens]
MKLWQVRIIPVLICLALVASGCTGIKSKGTKHVGVSSLINPLNITELLKRPEAEVLEYFQ